MKTGIVAMLAGLMLLAAGCVSTVDHPYGGDGIQTSTGEKAEVPDYVNPK